MDSFVSRLLDLTLQGRKYLGAIVVVEFSFAAHLEEVKLVVSYLGVRGERKHRRGVYLGSSVAS